MWWSSWPTWWVFVAPALMLTLMAACMAGMCAMMRRMFGRHDPNAAAPSGRGIDFAPTGPHVPARFPDRASAFEEYRAETLRRLDGEQAEFHDFLGRLRTAKDKAEFEQFLAERRPGSGSPA